MRNLVLQGVRQNNLKDIDLELPLGKAIVVTGPSGSGKSSLAFETIYAEGQRRYMASLSTYARQFLEKFRAPQAEKIMNIPPTIALEQFNPVRNSRATVGTSTEVYDYLRLLFGKVGIEFCDKCDRPMERSDLRAIFEKLSQSYKGKALLVGFNRLLPKRRAGVEEMLGELLRSGYTRGVLGGEIQRIEELSQAKGILGKKLAVIADRIRMPEGRGDSSLETRLAEAIKSAWESGEGQADVFMEGAKKLKLVESFYEGIRCAGCGKLSTPKSAISFSFNSPLGACKNCNGFGNTLELDEDLVVPDPRKSLARGAVDPLTKPSLVHWQKKLLDFCKEQRVDIDLPYKDLSPENKTLIFEGKKGKFKGVRGVFNRLEKDKYKMRIRVFISRYVSPTECSECRGNRLNDDVLRVRVGGKNIAEACEMTLVECYHFMKTLPLTKREKQTVKDVLRQVDRRLDYLNTVGLGYLTLSRLSRSLSGGEYQRILLATQLSQGLTDTLYVLDEPSIGLHPKDTSQLIRVLNRLLKLGNSLVVVEHDPEVIQWGEHIVDLGPGSGKRGGEIIFSGSKERFLKSDSRTAVAMKEWKERCKKQLIQPRPELGEAQIEVIGASENNLRNLDVAIPLNQLVVVTGVSGSGKSTLVVDTVYQALAKIFQGRSKKIGRFESIKGFEYIQSVELIDQSPIGKSSRSNPLTFMKGYDEVRRLFSNSRDATAKSIPPGHFSFNVPGGRCDTCEGEGRIKVDMVFMEDVWMPCEICNESRFKPHILTIRYKGRNIDDCLKLTVDEAYDFFTESGSLRGKLALLREVGLGYLQLGQPGYALSGGEAQRIKIARELSSASSRRGATLFILDEPTTGLHFDEINKLLSVFNRLIGAGHSVVVIEHNVQIICASDYVIDLGPDGGDNGGRVVDLGTPNKLAQKKLSHTGRYLAEILS